MLLTKPDLVENISDARNIIIKEMERNVPILEVQNGDIGADVILGVNAAAETDLDNRMAVLRTSSQLVILSDLKVGQKGAGNPESVRMDMDQHMGHMYPFSNKQKLEKITETHAFYEGETPWGGPVIPLEMISVLTNYTSSLSGFRSRGPAIGLFASQEVKMIDGPMMIGKDYLLEREIIALIYSRRKEYNCILTRY